jgi:hypothetical protein
MIDPEANWDFNNKNNQTLLTIAVSAEKIFGRELEGEENCRSYMEAWSQKILKYFILSGFCRVYFVDF